MSNLHTLSFYLFLNLPFFISVAARSAYCPSYDCNGLTVSYPFWRIDSQTITQFCGYENFEINCSTVNGHEIPSINLGGHVYYVQNITDEYNNIILSNYNLSTSAAIPNNCPKVRNTIKLGNLPFDFAESSNVNLRFQFNCTRVPMFATPLPCLDNGTRKSCVCKVNEKLHSFNWDKYSCDDRVTNMVLREKLNITKEFGEAMRRGFKLKWFPVGNYTTSDDDEASKGHVTFYTRLLIIILSAILLLVAFMVIIPWISKYLSTTKVASMERVTEDDINVDTFIEQYGSLTTRRYTYFDIQLVTNFFEVKVGKGGYGSVFKGKLADGRIVAVKLLNSSKASGQEFINEVASIGRTSHVNVVSLLGFCAEHRKRALIYEFMPNGSLEKFICTHITLEKSVHLGVTKLYEIAMGIAHGLDYLHRGCNTRILHLDIKPHNILLDEDFCPKIADFGLAKLYSRKESIVSMLEARGTIGYIAPEVFNRNFGGVSHKSDVYSYGMLLLEMVGERKKLDSNVRSGQSSELYFPDWIYNRLENNDYLLDDTSTAEEKDCARKMTIVGLWCIQTSPSQRPPIHEVIEMLDGSMEALHVPPKPFFGSPSRSISTTYSTFQIIPEITAIKHQ